MLVPVMLVLVMAAWPGAHVQAAENYFPRSSYQEAVDYFKCLNAIDPECAKGAKRCWTSRCDCMDEATRDTYEQYKDCDRLDTCYEKWQKCFAGHSERIYYKCSMDYQKCVCACTYNRTGGAKSRTTASTTTRSTTTQATTRSTATKATTIGSTSEATTRRSSTEATTIGSTTVATTRSSTEATTIGSTTEATTMGSKSEATTIGSTTAENGTCRSRSSYQESDGYFKCLKAIAPECIGKGSIRCWTHGCDCMDNVTRDTYEQYKDCDRCSELLERCKQSDKSWRCATTCDMDFEKCVCACTYNRTGGAKSSTS